MYPVHFFSPGTEYRRRCPGIPYVPRYDNYPDDIRRYDHDPRSPFYSNPLEDAVRDSEDEYRADHAELLGHLERLSIPHEVWVDCDPDEDGPNVSITFMLHGVNTHSGREGLYNATGGEAALLEAVRGLEAGDAEGIAKAAEIGHEHAE